MAQVWQILTLISLQSVFAASEYANGRCSSGGCLPNDDMVQDIRRTISEEILGRDENEQSVNHNDVVTEHDNSLPPQIVSSPIFLQTVEDIERQNSVLRSKDDVPDSETIFQQCIISDQREFTETDSSDNYHVHNVDVTCHVSPPAGYGADRLESVDLLIQKPAYVKRRPKMKDFSVSYLCDGKGLLSSYRNCEMGEWFLLHPSDRHVNIERDYEGNPNNYILPMTTAYRKSLGKLLGQRVHDSPKLRVTFRLEYRTKSALQPEQGDIVLRLRVQDQKRPKRQIQGTNCRVVPFNFTFDSFSKVTVVIPNTIVDIGMCQGHCSSPDQVGIDAINTAIDRPTAGSCCAPSKVRDLQMLSIRKHNMDASLQQHTIKGFIIEECKCFGRAWRAEEVDAELGKS